MIGAAGGAAVGVMAGNISVPAAVAVGAMVGAVAGYAKLRCLRVKLPKKPSMWQDVPIVLPIANSI